MKNVIIFDSLINESAEIVDNNSIENKLFLFRKEIVRIQRICLFIKVFRGNKFVVHSIFLFYSLPELGSVLRQEEVLISSLHCVWYQMCHN